MSKKNIVYETRIVTFVDLLGFSRRVNESGDVDLPGLIKSIKCLREYFPTPKRDQKNEHTSFHSFSDMIVRTRPCNNGPLFLEFTDIMFGIINAINNGHFVRGATTHGKVYFDKDGIVLGPAFIKAYEMESTEACYPRVIIDPNTLRKFEDKPVFSGPDEAPEECRKFIREHIRLDKDGYFFLDYLRWLHDNEDTYAVAQFYQKHKELIEANLQSQSVRIRKKYVWLGNYHNDVMKKLHWQTVKDPDTAQTFKLVIPYKMLELSS